MARPIAPTPVLEGKEAAKFLTALQEESRKPVGLTPTPKLDRAHESIVKKHGKNRQKHVR